MSSRPELAIGEILGALARLELLEPTKCLDLA
jgi:hypothetical protein